MKTTCNISDLSILYVGSVDVQSNSFRRYNTFREITKNVDYVNTDRYLKVKYISGFQHHLNIGPGIYLLNKKIRKLVKQKKYEVILIDNKPYLTLKSFDYIKKQQPAIKMVNLLTDDPFGKYTRSWSLLKRTAFLYDIFFVQRKVNIEELESIGAKRVELCYRSFDPEYNRPLLLGGEDITSYKTQIGFIGTYEMERASNIAYLIENNIPVSVTGNDWPNGEYWNIIKPYYKGPSVYSEKYIKAINGMEIALHFLRHGNRDEQDSRTFEIPACKVFMLAERSAVHTELFEENEEVVFFNSKEELLEKVKFYSNEKTERDRIALNGYNKCFSAGYDHRSRLVKVLETIININ